MIMNELRGDTHPSWPTTTFAVALSFPSEDRKFVRAVAEALGSKLGRENVFYDEWYEVELGGPNGDLKLDRVYERMSNLVVPFFSAHYQKPWCGLEWDGIRSMLLLRRNDDAVFAIKMEDCDIPGWRKTDFHINCNDRSPVEIAELIHRKILINKRLRSATEATVLPPVSRGDALATGQESNYRTRLPERTLESRSIEVEVRDHNRLRCPRANKGGRGSEFAGLLLCLLFINGLLFGWASIVASFNGLTAIWLVFPAIIVAVLASWAWIGGVGYLVRDVFDTELLFSETQLVIRRRMPDFLQAALLIYDNTIRFRSDSVWWDFEGDKILVWDGVQRVLVRGILEISAENLLDFQEQLARKLDAHNIPFRIGKPPRVRFYDHGIEIR